MLKHTLHFKYVQFIACQLHRSKAIFKKMLSCYITKFFKKVCSNNIYNLISFLGGKKPFAHMHFLGDGIGDEVDFFL